VKGKKVLRLRKSQFSRLMLTKTSQFAWELTHFFSAFRVRKISDKYHCEKSLFQKSFIVIAFRCFFLYALVCADISAIKTKFQIHQSPYIINKNNATSCGRFGKAHSRLPVTYALMVATCTESRENVVYYTKKICLGMKGFPSSM
jgi:hypothetical protein